MRPLRVIAFAYFVKAELETVGTGRGKHEYGHFCLIKRTGLAPIMHRMPRNVVPALADKHTRAGIIWE